MTVKYGESKIVGYPQNSKINILDKNRNEAEELFRKNVKYLLSNQPIKISDLELACGVQIGYFSRYINKKISKISLNVASNFCNYLEISMDDITTINFEKESLIAKMNELRKRIDEIDKD